VEKQKGSDVQQETTVAFEPGAGPQGRPPPSWLGPLRALWLVVVLGIIVLYLWGMPTYYMSLLRLCVEEPCISDAQLTPETFHSLQAAGVSLRFYALYDTVLSLFFVLPFWLIAGIIFWRRPVEPVALFVSFVLVTTSVLLIEAFSAVALLDPLLAVIVTLVEAIGWVAFATFFYIFPDGRFVPSWTRIAAAGWIIYQALYVLATFTSFGLPWLTPGIQAVLLLILFGSCLYAQLYRFRHASGLVQRQQTKWVVFGMTTTISALLLTGLPPVIIPGLGETGSLYDFVADLLVFLALWLIPLSIGIAILRYRLWDIDLLINRALVYSVLTVALGLVYGVSVVLLQYLFRMVTGQETDLTIVASTVSIAALFSPMRHGIQLSIDRRFYRQRYDAQQTLAELARTLRSEIDLESLQSELTRVIETTMKPEHVTIWLRKPERGSKL
jgi:hypothetical protein